MIFEVLLSCMHEQTAQLIGKSHLSNVRTLLINQCDIVCDKMIALNDKHRMLNTSTRGLSVSRNLAIQNAKADICLLADNDEIFVDNLEQIVLDAYDKIPQADIIIFKLSNVFKKLGNKIRKLKKYDLLRVASWMISFRTQAIKNKISFDENLGAGTGNGAGEENKFLLDCYKAGLQIYYVPKDIAAMDMTNKSTWFLGFDSSFFYTRGRSTRYILGLPIAVLYGFYYLVIKHDKYVATISTFDAAYNLFAGIIKGEIGKE